MTNEIASEAVSRVTFGNLRRMRMKMEQQQEFTGVRVAVEWWQFLIHPRKFMDIRKNNWNASVSAFVVLAWCAGLLVGVIGIYGLVFGSLMERSRSESVAAEQISETESEIVLDEWGLTPQPSLSLTLPEFPDKPVSSPQRAHFVFGFAYVGLDHVVPARLGSGAFPFLILGLYALLIGVCLFPATRILGNKSPIFDTIKCCLLILGYAAVTLTVLVYASTLLKHHCPGPTTFLSVASMFLVEIPVLILVVRSMFVSLATFFDFSYRKFMPACFGAGLFSIVIAPAILIPGAFLVVRLQHVFDLII